MISAKVKTAMRRCVTMAFVSQPPAAASICAVVAVVIALSAMRGHVLPRLAVRNMPVVSVHPVRSVMIMSPVRIMVPVARLPVPWPVRRAPVAVSVKFAPRPVTVKFPAVVRNSPGVIAVPASIVSRIRASVKILNP